MVFINNEYSHSKKKSVKKYDYVSNHAEIDLFEDIDEKYIEFGYKVIKAAQKVVGVDSFLHGRVDFILNEKTNEVMLLELEVIEPFLHIKGTQKNLTYCEAIKEILKKMNLKQFDIERDFGQK